MTDTERIQEQYSGMYDAMIRKDADALYVYLKEQKPGRIGWNFAKFLVDRNGAVVGRFAPTEKPNTLESAIEAVL